MCYTGGMANRLRFVVEVVLERDQGKFISNDELADEILPQIEGADPGSITVDESEYSVVEWSVERD
jgi:hypothetical protein